MREMFVRSDRQRGPGGGVNLATLMAAAFAAQGKGDDMLENEDFVKQVLATDFQQRALLSHDEVRVVAKHFQDAYDWDSEDFNICTAARTTEPLVSTICSHIMYPDSAMATAFDAPKLDGEPTAPFDERGIHPAEERTTRIHPTPFSAMENRREDERHLYFEIRDAYNPMLDPEVAAFVMLPQSRARVVEAILNPAVYPTPVPSDINLWDIPEPTDDETIRGVRLKDLHHPNDWRLMRTEVGDLQLREVDRVVHIAQTPHVSHRRRQLIEDDLWAANRKRLVRRNPMYEAVRNRREEEYCRSFLRGRHNLNRVFRGRQHYIRRTELNDRHLKEAIARYDQSEIDRYRDKLRWMEEMTNEEEMARQRKLAEMDRAWDDMAWWKYLYWVPWALLNQVGSKNSADL